MPKKFTDRFDPSKPDYEAPFLFTHVSEEAPKHSSGVRWPDDWRSFRLVVGIAVIVTFVVALAFVSNQDTSSDSYVPPATPTEEFLDVASYYGFDSGSSGSWSNGMLAWGYEICESLDVWRGDVYTVSGLLYQDNHTYGNGSFTYEGSTALVRAAHANLCPHL